MSTHIQPTQVSICNRALSKLPAARIAAIDENSAEAVACAEEYQPVMEAMLELHDWSFAVRRVTLAAIANDRPEWVYAYAQPDDCAGPKRVLTNITSASNWYAIAGSYPPIGCRPCNGGWWYDYTLANDVIYTNVPDAILEYQTRDASEVVVSALFADAWVLELASRICIPILRNETRLKALLAQAELAKARAIADDRNKYPATVADDYVSDTERARMGGWR